MAGLCAAGFGHKLALDRWIRPAACSWLAYRQWPRRAIVRLLFSKYTVLAPLAGGSTQHPPVRGGTSLRAPSIMAESSALPWPSPPPTLPIIAAAAVVTLCCRARVSPRAARPSGAGRPLRDDLMDNELSDEYAVARYKRSPRPGERRMI